MMSLRRRFELLHIAKESDAWIVEDDYFSEYRAGSGRVASLQSMDHTNHVIYIGNFSKSIAPSLRIGYLVLPPELVGTFTRVRAAMSRQPPGIDQAVLAEFISEGHLERHIRTTLNVYRHREEVLIEAIRSQGTDILTADPSGTECISLPGSRKPLTIELWQRPPLPMTSIQFPSRLSAFDECDHLDWSLAIARTEEAASALQSEIYAPPCGGSCQINRRMTDLGKMKHQYLAGTQLARM